MLHHPSQWNTHSYCKKMKHQPHLKMGTRTVGLREIDNYEAFHFFENEIEEDFYSAPAPSEDIWKKFELIPTPPRSPRRDEEDTDVVDGIFSPKSTTERLQLVSEILDDPISQTIVTPEFFISCGPNLKSKLIQDCMWSGNTDNDGDSTSESSTITVPKKNDVVSSSSEINASTECVDPSSVFPYPINDVKKIMNITGAKLTTPTPSDYDDSDGSEDDDDDDGDDEIDVVSVVRIRKKKSKKCMSQLVPNVKVKKTNIVCSPRAPHSPKSSIILHHNIHHHNYSLKRKSVSLPGSPQPHSKKLKRELSVQESPVSKCSMQQSNSDCRNSRSGSDSEDSEDKRAQHNVLERRRRNDLKFSFFTLRDNVPELEKQDRAPKVMILKKAADHIVQLRREQMRLEHIKASEESRREQLHRRLMQLRKN